MLSTASTMTKRAATSARVDQLISRARANGLLRALIETTAVIARAARHVGKPRSLPNDDAVNRTATTAANPPSTRMPAFLNGLASTSPSMAERSSFRKSQRITMNVAAMDRRHGMPYDKSHAPRGGIWLWNTTRFAGLEIGRRKEAALAIKAQTKRYGRGFTLALRTAVKIAGVRTTAVASFDMKIVTIVPTA